MNLDQQSSQNIIELVQGLLDRGYTRATNQVIRAITRDVMGSGLNRRLNDLTFEAQRLQDDGEKITPDNPYVLALISDLEDILTDNTRRINDASTDLQESSISSAGRLTRELAAPNISDDQLQSLVGVAWNVPSPETVAAFVDFINTPDWENQLEKYRYETLRTIKNQVLRGLLEGWSPIKTAREIRRMSTTLPVYQANNMMRTLQLQSYRTAQVANMRANSDILDGHIRIAALDDRTCMACIALHGTTLKINERVDGHHQCRCTSVPMVKGREREIQTGPEWFNSLPEQRQIKIAGASMFNALKSGDISWSEIPQGYNTPPFGRMIRPATLKSLGISKGQKSGDFTKRGFRTETDIKVSRQVKSDDVYNELTKHSQFRKYFEQNYGIKLSIAKGATPEGLREFSKTFDALIEDYPEVLNRLDEINIKPKNRMPRGVAGEAYLSGRRINLRVDDINKTDKVKPSFGNWVVRGSTRCAAILTHEFAHLVHYHHKLYSRQESPVDFKTLKYKNTEDFLSRALYSFRQRFDIKNDISGYGATNDYEVFAEGFVAHRYIPELKKNDTILQFETILKTLKIDPDGESFNVRDESEKPNYDLTPEEEQELTEITETLGISK